MLFSRIGGITKIRKKEILFGKKKKKKIRRNVSFTINLRRHEISALCRPKGSSLKAFAITNGN